MINKKVQISEMLPFMLTSANVCQVFKAISWGFLMCFITCDRFSKFSHLIKINQLIKYTATMTMQFLICSVLFEYIIYFWNDILAITAWRPAALSGPVDIFTTSCFILFPLFFSNCLIHTKISSTIIQEGRRKGRIVNFFFSF